MTDPRDEIRQARQEARAEWRATRQALQEDPDEQAKAQHFVQQYAQGNPTGGQGPQQALHYLQMVHDEASPQELQTAIQQTVQNLPPAQKAELAQLLQQHQGQAATAGGGIEDTLSGLVQSVSSSGGSNTAMLSGLLGSLVGAGAQATGSPAAQSGGPRHLVDSLLGRVFGRDEQQTPETTQTGGFDNLSPLLKTVLGGVAAYGVQQMMSKQR